jgi:hypothetical protein
MPLPRFLAPDHDRYEGVRPIHICLLRTFYSLMAAFVATDAWRVILTHGGRGITRALSPGACGRRTRPWPSSGSSIRCG